MRKPFCDGVFTQIQHQIRSVNSLNRVMALEFSHPDHRHAVGGRQKCAVENVPKCWIALRLAHSMHARDCNVTAPAFAHSLKQKLPRAGLIEHADADAEHVYLFDFHRRLRLAVSLDFSFCGARCSKSSKSLGRAVARLFRRKGTMSI